MINVYSVDDGDCPPRMLKRNEALSGDSCRVLLRFKVRQDVRLDERNH